MRFRIAAVAAAVTLPLAGIAHATECDADLTRLDARVNAWEQGTVADRHGDASVVRIAEMRALLDAARILDRSGEHRACDAALKEVADRLAALERPPVLPADRLLNAQVEDRRGEAIGTIEHVVVHRRADAVPLAVLQVGGVIGLGGDLRPVPFDQLLPTADAKRFELAIPRQRLEQAPPYDDDAGTAAQEKWLAAVQSFYGLHASGTRTAADTRPAADRPAASRTDPERAPIRERPPTGDASTSTSAATTPAAQDEKDGKVGKDEKPAGDVQGAADAARAATPGEDAITKAADRLARLETRLRDLETRVVALQAARTAPATPGEVTVGAPAAHDGSPSSAGGDVAAALPASEPTDADAAGDRDAADRVTVYAGATLFEDGEGLARERTPATRDETSSDAAASMTDIASTPRSVRDAD